MDLIKTVPGKNFTYEQYAAYRMRHQGGGGGGTVGDLIYFDNVSIIES